MADETKFQPLESEIDPSIDINYPVFDAGLVKVRFRGFTVDEETKEGKENPNTYAHFTNEEVLTAKSGAVKQPGEFTFKMYVPSNPTDKPNSKWDWQVARQEVLARLKKAAGLPPKGKFNSEEVIGKLMNLKLSIGKNQRDEPSNNIDAVLPITA